MFFLFFFDSNIPAIFFSCFLCIQGKGEAEGAPLLTFAPAEGGLGPYEEETVTVTLRAEEKGSFSRTIACAVSPVLPPPEEGEGEGGETVAVGAKKPKKKEKVEVSYIEATALIEERPPKPPTVCVAGEGG